MIKMSKITLLIFFVLATLAIVLLVDAKKDKEKGIIDDDNKSLKVHDDHEGKIKFIDKRAADEDADAGGDDEKKVKKGKNKTTKKPKGKGGKSKAPSTPGPDASTTAGPNASSTGKPEGGDPSSTGKPDGSTTTSKPGGSTTKKSNGKSGDIDDQFMEDLVRDQAEEKALIDKILTHLQKWSSWLSEHKGKSLNKMKASLVKIRLNNIMEKFFTDKRRSSIRHRIHASNSRLQHDNWQQLS